MRRWKRETATRNVSAALGRHIPLWQYRTILSAVLRSQIFCQSVQIERSQSGDWQAKAVRYDEKYASKTVLKALAANCAVLPYIFLTNMEKPDNVWYNRDCHIKRFSRKELLRILEKCKDPKDRILWECETYRQDGRYMYRYTDIKGQRRPTFIR